MLSFKDRSYLSEDKNILLFTSKMFILHIFFCICSVKNPWLFKNIFSVPFKKNTAQWYHNVATAKYITYIAAFTAL